MNGRRSEAAKSLIAVDEVGIAFGVIGDLRLKTAFQPVFSRQGPMLVPIAVTASSVVQQAGQAGGQSIDQDLVDGLAPLLAVRNLANVGADLPEIGLMLDLPAGFHVVDLQALFATADLVDVRRSCMVFDVSRNTDNPLLHDLLRTLCNEGAAVGIDLLGVSNLPTAATVPMSRLVRISAKVYRGIMSESALQDLLSPLVATLRKGGFMLQIEGISDSEDLRVAVAVGADCLQGNLLAGPALAGTDFDDRPTSLSAFLGNRGNVISMSGCSFFQATKKAGEPPS